MSGAFSTDVVFVAGANRGIRPAIAEPLADADATAMLAACSQDAIETVAHEILARGGRAI